VESRVRHVRSDRRLALLAGLAAAGALGMVGLNRAVRAHAGPHASAPAPSAGEVGALRTGLVDQAGRRFELQRLAGRPSLLTFGFTQCSSTCPISLQAASELIARGPANRVQVVFVSLDPLADTPAQLAKYLANFSPAILGVTGDPIAIEAMAETFRVGVRRGVPEGLAHSSMWYLLDERVVVRSVAKYDAPVAELETLLARTRVSTR
jgi:protein SCO1/2